MYHQRTLTTVTMSEKDWIPSTRWPANGDMALHFPTAGPHSAPQTYFLPSFSTLAFVLSSACNTFHMNIYSHYSISYHSRHINIYISHKLPCVWRRLLWPPITGDYLKSFISSCASYMPFHLFDPSPLPDPKRENKGPASDLTLYFK